MPNRDLLPGSIGIDDMRGYLQIDRNALDEDMMRQPELFFRVGEEHALAVSHRDQLKEEYKRVDAQLYLDVKQELTDAGTKTTEAHVAAEVSNHPEHTQMRNDYLTACRQVDLWAGLKEAYMQRGYMLKSLAALFAANYFSRTSVQGEDAQVVQDSAVRERREAIKRKRRKLRSP